MRYKGIIFDRDGVICSAWEYHRGPFALSASVIFRKGAHGIGNHSHALLITLTLSVLSLKRIHGEGSVRILSAYSVRPAEDRIRPPSILYTVSAYSKASGL